MPLFVAHSTAAMAKVLNPFNIKPGYDETTFKGDLTGPNTWLNDRAATNDSYTGTLDYRVEAATSLYKVGGHTGTLVTRVEGFSFW